MSANHLEELVAEWYEFKGYFLRRNVNVGPRPQGGFATELDIVAFHPVTKHLVHLEPSLDADSWAVRERRFRKKFDEGRQHRLYIELCVKVE
jgi:hypothetical protein